LGRTSLDNGEVHLPIPQFQRELGRRRIPVNYTAENLEQDLQAAAELAQR
jgi:predicted HTH domain antitoxin